MKKILLFCLILFTTKAFAQTISFGLTAGINDSAVPGNGNPNTTVRYSISDSYQVGFHAGGLIDIAWKNFSLQPGLIYTTMGGKHADNSESEKISLNYVQMPVNFLYTMQSPEGQFFIGGGPYIGFGISGKYDYTEYFSGNFHGEENLSFGNQLHNPDIGLSALIGYRLNLGLTISASFGHGLTDAYNYGANNKNEVLSLSVSYFFKNK